MHAHEILLSGKGSFILAPCGNLPVLDKHKLYADLFISVPLKPKENDEKYSIFENEIIFNNTSFGNFSPVDFKILNCGFLSKYRDVLKQFKNQLEITSL